MQIVKPKRAPRKIKSKKLCPLCGQERLYFGYNLWCLSCDEHAIKIFSRDSLRESKKRIELGLVRKGGPI